MYGFGYMKWKTHHGIRFFFEFSGRKKNDSIEAFRFISAIIISVAIDFEFVKDQRVIMHGISV